MDPSLRSVITLYLRAVGGLGLGLSAGTSPGGRGGRAQVAEAIAGRCYLLCERSSGAKQLKSRLEEPGEGPPFGKHPQQPPRFSLSYL